MAVRPATVWPCGGAVGQVHRGGPDSDGSSAKRLGRRILSVGWFFGRSGLVVLYYHFPHGITWHIHSGMYYHYINM